MGIKVVARFDPQRMHDGIHVYTLDGRYICHAAAIETAGFNSSEDAREHTRARKHWMNGAKAQLDAEVRMTALQVAAQLPTAGPQQNSNPQIVMPVRPATPLEPIQASNTPEDQAARAALIADMAHDAQIIPIPKTPREKYTYWTSLDSRLTAGHTINPQEHKFHHTYQRSTEWQAQHEFAQDESFTTYGLNTTP